MSKDKIKVCYIKFYTLITKDCDFFSKLENIIARDFSPKAPQMKRRVQI